jgi:hypothetical protein
MAQNEQGKERREGKKVDFTLGISTFGIRV